MFINLQISGGNNYTGSTDDFKSRTGNHLDSGTLPVGDKVTLYSCRNGRKKC